MSIRQAVATINAELVRLRSELVTLQDKCRHKKATREGRSSTGYSEATQYWWDYTCPDCEKKWSVDQ